jgi:hypothetical protein
MRTACWTAVGGSRGAGLVQDQHGAVLDTELGQRALVGVRAPGGRAERPVVAVGLAGDLEEVGHQLP